MGGREGVSVGGREGGKGDGGTMHESVILFPPSSFNNYVSVSRAKINDQPGRLCIRKVWLNGRRTASIEVDADLAALQIGLSI